MQSFKNDLDIKSYSKIKSIRKEHGYREKSPKQNLIIEGLTKLEMFRLNQY